MDIKRKVFDEMITRYKTMHIFEKVNIERTAQLIKECILHGGVVQLCGAGHAEEFVNELNYRAGGIAPIHAFRVNDLYIRKLISEEEKAEFFEHEENAEKFISFYELNDKDMYILVSLTADEPLLLELAKKARAKGQRVVFICNKAHCKLKESKEAIFEYCDVVLDMGAAEKDVLTYIGEEAIGQSWTTTANVMAQMITSEVYRLYHEEHTPCPVLLSANLKGADVHNNLLTDSYGKRVRG